MTLSLGAQAQWGNKLKNKVLDKLEQKADEKIDKTINSAVDKPVDKTEEKVKESVKTSGDDSDASDRQPPSGHEGMSEDQMNQMMQMFGGGNVSIEDYPDISEIEPSRFKGSFDMVFETTKNGKKKEEGQVSWYVRSYDVAMLPDAEANGQKQDMRMIIQRQKGIMIILTGNGGDKTGMIMELKTMSVDLSDTEFEDDIENMTVDVQKSNTRTINGYKCYKVLAENDEFKSEAWVTEQLPLDFQQLLGFMNVQTKGSNPYEEKFGQIRGMVIESTSTDKKNGEVTFMQMKNIQVGNPPDKFFSIDGYNLMKLPDFGGFGG